MKSEHHNFKKPFTNMLELKYHFSYFLVKYIFCLKCGKIYVHMSNKHNIYIVTFIYVSDISFIFSNYLKH